MHCEVNQIFSKRHLNFHGDITPCFQQRPAMYQVRSETWQSRNRIVTNSLTYVGHMIDYLRRTGGKTGCCCWVLSLKRRSCSRRHLFLDSVCLGFRSRCCRAVVWSWTRWRRLCSRCSHAAGWCRTLPLSATHTPSCMCAQLGTQFKTGTLPTGVSPRLVGVYSNKCPRR